MIYHLFILHYYVQQFCFFFVLSPLSIASSPSHVQSYKSTLPLTLLHVYSVLSPMPPDIITPVQFYFPSVIVCSNSFICASNRVSLSHTRCACPASYPKSCGSSFCRFASVCKLLLFIVVIPHCKNNACSRLISCVRSSFNVLHSFVSLRR